MKKRIFFMLSALVALLSPGLERASVDEPHPEITLIDYDGNEISLESNVPYSPKNTCGECHDYDAITNAYHFQQGRTDADGNITQHLGQAPNVIGIRMCEHQHVEPIETVRGQRT